MLPARPGCLNSTVTRPSTWTGRRSRRSGEWRWTFFLGRSSSFFGFLSTVSPLAVAYSVNGRGTDGLYVGGGRGGGNLALDWPGSIYAQGSATED
jgi:hypothetical protein